MNDKHMKRNRARVTLGGQCLLLQISLRIKMFKILKKSQNIRMNHTLPDILLNPYIFFLKILETSPRSSKNAQKLIKII